MEIPSRQTLTRIPGIPVRNGYDTRVRRYFSFFLPISSTSADASRPRVYPCGRYLSRRAARVRVLSTRVSEYLPERARVRPWNQPPAMPICVYLITREAAQGTNECVLMAGGLGITIRGRPSSISPKATRVFSWTLRSTARVRVLLSTGICGYFACTSTGTGTGIYGYLASADAPYPRALRMFQYFHDFEYPC